MCNGDIIEVSDQEYDPAKGPKIFGPGSKQQYKTVTVLYCETCGVQYHHLPKPSEPSDHDQDEAGDTM